MRARSNSLLRREFNSARYVPSFQNHVLLMTVLVARNCTFARWPRLCGQARTEVAGHAKRTIMISVIRDMGLKST